MLTIGILALQGGFRQHAMHLEQCQVSWLYVKKPQQLSGIDGLIIPGGESSSLLKLMEPFDWVSNLRSYTKSGGAVFGTCAGMILLANRVTPSQKSLKIMSIDVERNSYGRQLDSFVAQGDLKLPSQDQSLVDMVFIRAPRVTSFYDSVKVLARYKDQAVLVQQGRVLAASFHPELGQDTVIHNYFCKMAAR